MVTNIDEARKRLQAYASNRKIPAQHDSDIRAVLDALDAAERLLEMASGVAASSIPDMSLRGKPVAAVVGLATTLSAAELERDEALAVIEQAKAALQDRDGDPTGRIERILRAENILSAAPADALRAVKAEAWREGFLDCVEWWEIHHAQDIASERNPYRETKEQ